MRTVKVKNITLDGLIEVQVVKHKSQASQGRWFTTENINHRFVGSDIIIENHFGNRFSRELIDKSQFKDL